MDNSKALILWIGGFTGVALLYAAYKGTSLMAVIQGGIKQPVSAAAAAKGWGGMNHPGSFLVGTVTPDQTLPAPTLAGDMGTSPYGDLQGTGLPYSIARQDGQAMVLDAYGMPVQVVPAAYQGNPATYVYRA